MPQRLTGGVDPLRNFGAMMFAAEVDPERSLGAKQPMTRVDPKRSFDPPRCLSEFKCKSTMDWQMRGLAASAINSIRPSTARLRPLGALH